MQNNDPSLKNKDSAELLTKFTSELLLKLDKNYNPNLLPDDVNSELDEKNYEQLQATQVETESQKCQTISSNIKQSSAYYSVGENKSYCEKRNE